MRQCRLVNFGRGGHSELMRSVKTTYGSTQCRVSGYSSPENWSPDTDTDYSDALFIDTRPATATPAGVAHVFSGPLCDPDLVPGAVDRLGEPGLISRGLQGTFAALLSYHQNQTTEKPRSLDSVSPEEFVAGWLKLGARAGRLVDGKIQWVEG